MKNRSSITPRSKCQGSSEVNTLLTPFSWAPCGNAYIQSYSFDIALSLEGRLDPNSHEISGTIPLTPIEQIYARTAMDKWEQVCQITFQYDLQSTQPNTLILGADNIIAEGVSRLGKTLTQLNPDIPSLEKYADVYIYRGSTDVNLSPGGQGFSASLLHELGHSFGLTHPFYNNQFPDKPILSTSKDHLDITLMSYTFGRYSVGGQYNPATPMLYDIAAAQTLYGANTGYMSGDTRYYYNTTDQSFKAQDSVGGTLTLLGKVMTLWDAGDIDSDTIDFSAITTDTRIDLREGIDPNSNSDGKGILSPYVTSFNDYRIFLAYNSNIENAKGGSGDDDLYGNPMDNLLEGGTGNDRYFLKIPFGSDTISDSDGKGQIFLDGVQIKGTATLKDSTADDLRWMLSHGTHTFTVTQSGNSLVLTEDNTRRDSINRISIQNFDFTHGQMDISLEHAKIVTKLRNGSDFVTALREGNVIQPIIPSSQGDPHFSTIDRSLNRAIRGVRYDDQMPGERVLLKGTGVNDTFEIQARHELWRWGGMIQVSTTNTVAMRVDGNTVVTFRRPDRHTQTPTQTFTPTPLPSQQREERQILPRDTTNPFDVTGLRWAA